MKALGLIRTIALAGLGIAIAIAPAAAQVRTIDPNSANADLAPAGGTDTPYTPPPTAPASAMDAAPPPTTAPAASSEVQSAAPAAVAPGNPNAAGSTYQQEDVLAAAEGVFGKGAEGLAKMIETVLKDQGEPNAYVAGREAGGAIGVGLRYGSGTLFHKIEGNQPVYWTGPSLGFDLGASGSKTFMLIYNLYDSNDLYKRFPGGEGVIYLVGGFNASYQRRGDIVVIPIRLGVGWRLGANVGYLKFTRKSNLLPF
jgi:hypothetical protein